MGKYETTFSIGDLVYTATSTGIDREVIKAVKIVGLNEEVYYGFKEDRSDPYSLFFFRNDEYVWYKPSQLFESKENAQACYENLKAQADAENEKEEAKRKKQRKAELEEELAELENE